MIQVDAGGDVWRWDYSYTDNNGHNNGNVMSTAFSRDSDRTQFFGYDELNRISEAYSQASTGGKSWGDLFTCDSWGNLSISPKPGKDHGESFQNATNAKNQLTGFAYDGAGNLTDGGHYGFNAENRLTTVNGQSAYRYDANGQRAMNLITGIAYWYGSDGSVLWETDLAGNFKKQEVYFGSQRIAEVSPTDRSYVFTDHLGNVRVVGNPITGSVFDTDYAPFGRVEYGSVPTEYKFTGKGRDTETGLDYFGARYYASTMGRFLSPDPSGLTYADQTNPQSFNLYSYALNNPLKFTDPTGMYCYYGDTSPDSSDWSDNSQYDFHSDKATCEGNTAEGGGKWYDDPSTTVTVNGDDGSSSSVDTTLSTSTAYITPVAQDARIKLLGTLVNANPCSAFFDEASSQSGQGSSAQVFANTDIRLNPNAGVMVGGQAEQGSGSAGPIFINPNSAFSHGTVAHLRAGLKEPRRGFWRTSWAIKQTRFRLMVRMPTCPDRTRTQ